MGRSIFFLAAIDNTFGLAHRTLKRLGFDEIDFDANTGDGMDFLVDFIVERLEITGYFSNVIGGDKLDCIKPSGCPLDVTREKLGVTRERSIMVGDMEIDILAGRAAGITTCGVTYGIGTKEEIIKAGPDYILSDIGELAGVIK